MIHAYQEIYLSNVQSMLGDAFDYAINICQIPGDDFVKLFVVSSVSRKIENGEPAYLSGKSGIEVAIEIIAETTGKSQSVKVMERFGRSKEYWVGWAVAYYQWYSDRKFSDIFKVVQYSELEKMYYPLHEADVGKFVDIVGNRMKECFPDTNLKRIRSAYGCSQSELAKRSGVSLRSIQMYEHKHKDINKASVDSVYRIAKVLGCRIEDLLEK